MKEGMPTLNIEDPKAHELACRIAEATGEDNLARVVIDALEERWSRISQKSPDEKYAEMLRLVDEWSRTAIVDTRSANEILYDEDGLPR
jgi:hypothetical protein